MAIVAAEGRPVRRRRWRVSFRVFLFALGAFSVGIVSLIGAIFEGMAHGAALTAYSAWTVLMVLRAHDRAVEEARQDGASALAQEGLRVLRARDQSHLPPSEDNPSRA